MKEKGQIILFAFAVLITLVLLYLGIWWLRGDAVNRNAQIRQDTYGRQNALVEQILDDIREVENPNVPPNQRAAVIDQICDSAAKLTGSIELPNNARNFINGEC